MRWILYQLLRFLVLWAALVTLAASFGVPCAMVAAALFGLTLRYDYWSNTVEFLAACLVASHCLPWPLGLGAGLVLGLGRETLPFLALAGGWPIALGGAASTLAVRHFTDLDPKWESSEKEMQYGKSRWRDNLSIACGKYPITCFDLNLYFLIACLAAFTSPLLTVALVGTTLAFARIDEPRVLTMLVPFAALTVTHWLSLG